MSPRVELRPGSLLAKSGAFVAPGCDSRRRWRSLSSPSPSRRDTSLALWRPDCQRVLLLRVLMGLVVGLFVMICSGSTCDSKPRPFQVASSQFLAYVGRLIIKRRRAHILVCESPKTSRRRSSGSGGSEETCVTGGVGLGHLGHVGRPHQPVDPLPQSSKPQRKRVRSPQLHVRAGTGCASSTAQLKAVCLKVKPRETSIR